MPGGRSQAPADQECLHCPERPSVPSSPEESLSRQSGSEGRSERTFPHSAVSEPEEERPPSVSGTGEVSGRGEQDRMERWGLPGLCAPSPFPVLTGSQLEKLLHVLLPSICYLLIWWKYTPRLPTTFCHALCFEAGMWAQLRGSCALLFGKGACLRGGTHHLGQGATNGPVVRVSWTCILWFSKGLGPG